MPQYPQPSGTSGTSTRCPNCSTAIQVRGQSLRKKLGTMDVENCLACGAKFLMVEGAPSIEAYVDRLIAAHL